MADKQFYIWKDRNKLCICEGQTKQDKFFYYDVNDFSIHGFSGRKVKNIPSGFAFSLKDVSWYGNTRITRIFDNESTKTLWLAITSIIEGYYSWEMNKKFFPAFEKLVNALFLQGYQLSFSVYSWSTYMETIQKAIDNNECSYADIIEGLNDENLREQNGLYCIALSHLQNIVVSIAETNYYKKYESHFETLGKGFTIETAKHFEHMEEWEQWENVIWEWLEHPQVLAAKRMLRVYDSDILIAIEHALFHCKMLERKPEKGTPFFQWQVLERDYEAIKNEIQNKTIARTQRLEFAFEDDNFIAIVPTTVQEFVDEGAAMGNCIGGIWLNGSNYGNYPEQGTMNRGAVFVRRKDNPLKPFIDCDFILDTGRICQFYGKYNNDIDSKEIQEFRIALQKHLIEVCQG